MALETLERAMGTAQDLLNLGPVDLETLQTMQRQEVHFLGNVVLADGVEHPAFRVYTGPDDLVGKGGIRFEKCGDPNAPDRDATRHRAEELSAEMLSKVALRDLIAPVERPDGSMANGYRGAKGVVDIDPYKLDAQQKIEVAEQYEGLMEAARLAGHDKDIPAGDVGTNGLADVYANRFAANNPDNPYRWAVITGKSPENHGLGSRAGATARGGISSLHAVMANRGETKASVAIMGFGNVGGWFANYAHSDPEQRVKVMAIGEREATIWTTNPAGLPITDAMVRRIADNPNWRGDKMMALMAMILNENPGYDVRISFNDEMEPNPVDIREFDVDYFVPAALGDVITMDNVHRLGARKGVLELANGPTTADAHDYLVGQGLDVIPDILANGGGVDGSIIEHRANIDLADGRITELPKDSEVEALLAKTSEELTRRVLDTAAEFKTRDLRVAAAIIISRTLLAHKALEAMAEVPQPNRRWFDSQTWAKTILGVVARWRQATKAGAGAAN